MKQPPLHSSPTKAKLLPLRSTARRWATTTKRQHVMACLAEGKTESPLWSLDDSLNLINLLDAARADAGIVY